MTGLFGFCGAFKETAQMRELMEDISDGLGDWTDKESLNYLDVPKSKLSEMRALQSAGPGVLRFGNLPARFWVRFLIARCRRFGLVVLEDLSVRPASCPVPDDAIERRPVHLDAIELRPRMAKAALSNRKVGAA